VYIGVAPEFRRRGLASAMLGQAISHARRVGWRRITLAADAANLPAVKLYESFRFAASHHRDAWVFTRRDAGAGLPSENGC
jgi:ribosomal protein S18 acetylase RimI-like enzyme